MNQQKKTPKQVREWIKKNWISLFFRDKETGRVLEVGEFNSSIWVCLTFPYEERIDKSCFLGSRSEIKIELNDLKFYSDRKHCPPMVKEFSTPKSWLKNITKDKITVEWKNENLVVKICGEPFLFFAKSDKKGYCKSILENGIYGNKWNQVKYDEIFK